MHANAGAIRKIEIRNGSKIVLSIVKRSYANTQNDTGAIENFVQKLQGQ